MVNNNLVGGRPTPLKNISQWEGLSHILWKKVPNHQPALRMEVLNDDEWGINDEFMVIHEGISDN